MKEVIGELTWVLRAEKEKLKADLAAGKKEIAEFRDQAKKAMGEAKAASAKAIDSTGIRKVSVLAKKEFRDIRDDWRRTCEDIRKTNDKAWDAVEQRNEKASVQLARNISGAMTLGGAAMTAGITMPLIAAGKEAVKFAVDLESAQKQARKVFREQTNDVEQFSKSAIDAYGLSERAALDHAAAIGTIFTATGTARREAASMSLTITKLASDFASFHDMDQEDAFEKFKAAVAGSGDALKEFGINLGDSAVQQKAVSMGLVDAKGKLTDNQKALVRYRMIVEQTKAVQGDFAESLDDVANQQQAAKAEADNLASSYGKELIPIQRELIKEGREVLKWFNDLSAEEKNATVKAGILVAALGPGIGLVGSMIGVVNAGIGLLKFYREWKTAAEATAAAQATLNTTTGLGGLAGMMKAAGPVALVGMVGQQNSGDDSVYGGQAGAARVREREAKLAKDVADRVRSLGSAEKAIRSFEMMWDRDPATAGNQGAGKEIYLNMIRRFAREAAAAIQMEADRLRFGGGPMAQFKSPDPSTKKSGDTSTGEEKPGDKPRTPSARDVADTARKWTLALMDNLSDSINTPAGEHSCAYFASRLIEKMSGVDIPGKNGIGSARGLRDYLDKSGGSVIPFSKAQPGDLVFMKGNGPSGVHVGVYAGNGKYIDASGKPGSPGAVKGRVRSLGSGTQIMSNPFTRVAGGPSRSAMLPETDDQLDALIQYAEKAVRDRLESAAKTEVERFVLAFGRREENKGREWAYDAAMAEAAARDRIAAEGEKREALIKSISRAQDQLDDEAAAMDQLQEEFARRQELERGFAEMMADLRREAALGVNAGRVANLDYDLKNTPWKFAQYTQEQMSQMRSQYAEMDRRDKIGGARSELDQASAGIVGMLREDSDRIKDRDAQYLDYMRDLNREMNSLLGLSDDLYQKQDLLKEGFLEWQAEAIIVAQKEIEQFRKTQEELMGLAERGSNILVDGIEAGLQGRNPFESLADSFRNVMNQMISEWLAAQAKMLIFKVLGGAIGGGGGGARASGGPVSAGVSYKVNEMGPEYFIPSANGHVVNSTQARHGTGLGAGGDVYHFHFPLQNVSQQELPAFARNLEQMSVTALTRAQRNQRRDGVKR